MTADRCHVLCVRLAWCGSYGDSLDRPQAQAEAKERSGSQPGLALNLGHDDSAGSDAKERQYERHLEVDMIDTVLS